MVSTPLLLLTLALVALVSVVSGDNVVHSESSEANVHPHSFTRHTLPSRTLLNTEEAGPEVSGNVFNPVQSWASLFPPATPFLHDKVFGAGPPINQVEEEDEEDDEEEGDVDLMNAAGGYYESHVGSKRNSGPIKPNRHFRNYQHHRAMYGLGGNHAWASNDLKRERSNTPTLSVESSLDLIRQKFIQELRRRQLIEKQKQIESNGDLLSSIGKRSGLQSSMTKH